MCKELTEGFPIKRYPEKLKNLHDNCPLLFKFLCSLAGDALPTDVIPLISQLLRIAAQPFLERSFIDDNVTTQENINSYLSYFPHHPVIRGRSNYDLDAENADKKSRICTKRYGRHPTLLPGIFRIQCRHGK